MRILNNREKEKEKIDKSIRLVYQQYVVNWINCNISYYSLEPPLVNIVNRNSCSDDPINLVKHYVLKLSRGNNKYIGETKKEFLNKTIELVLDDMKSVMSESNKNLRNELICCLAENRNIGWSVVVAQKKIEKIDQTNYFYQHLMYVITKPNNNEIEKNNVDMLEKYIATQNDAIEVALKLTCKYQNENCNELYTENNIGRLLSLAHALILILNTKRVCMAGCNYDNILHINDAGEFIFDDQTNISKMNVDDFNYKFGESWKEYTDKEKDKLISAIYNKYSLDLGMLCKISDWLKKLGNKIFIFDNKEKLLLTIRKKFYLSKQEAIAIIENFAYIEPNGRDIDTIRLLDECKDEKLFSNRPLYCQNGCFIVYCDLAWKAIDYLIVNIYCKPEKYIDGKTQNLIATNFERLVAEQIKNNFPKADVITDVKLSSICKSDRQIDVLCILNKIIYVIECKRLDLAITNNELILQGGKIRNKFFKQIDAEVMDFNKNKNLILKEYSEQLTTEITTINEYIVRGVIVTKDITPAHFHKDGKHVVVTIDKIVEFIKIDITTL